MVKVVRLGDGSEFSKKKVAEFVSSQFGEDLNLVTEEKIMEVPTVETTTKNKVYSVIVRNIIIFVVVFKSGNMELYIL